MEEEMPPEWMWPFDSELDTWFDNVKQKRENPGSSSSHDEAPMMTNEYARRG